MDIINTILTMKAEWIMAITTIIYTLFTGWLILESRVARKNTELVNKKREQPQIDISTERCDKTRSIINLVIQNNGLSGAYEILLSTKKGFLNKEVNYQEYEDIKNWGPFKNGISFLPPQGKRVLFLTFLTTDFKRKIKEEFDITVKYKNQEGEFLQKKFIIHFKEFENTMLTPENPLYKISDSLEKVARSLGKIEDTAKGSLKKLKNGNLQRNLTFKNISEEEIRLLLINIFDYGDKKDLWLNPFIYDTQFIVKTFREILMKKKILLEEDKNILKILNSLYFDEACLGENLFEENFKKLVELLKKNPDSSN